MIAYNKLGSDKMDGNLFLDMLHIAILGSIISSQIIQRLKHIIKQSSRINKLISSVISFVTGFAYAYCFYTTKIVYDVWIGLFTLIGSEGLYKSFKGSFGLETINNGK